MANLKGNQVVLGTSQQTIPAEHMAKNTVATILNAMLDKEGFRKRFDELLGKRMPAFMGSLVSMVNGDDNLKQCFLNNSTSVIQSALKAASYNLPIDPALGFAYIIPFKDTATFIMGYKGMRQLALRTGAYTGMNVVDIRAGELKHWDRLTEDCEIEWIEDEDLRESTPIVGYLGYFRLCNGFEKKIYKTVKQINKHEEKFRKGKYRPKIWNTNFEEMASKTVFRELISKWGLMSIDYQSATPETIKFAEGVATGTIDDEELQAIDVTTAAVEQPAADNGSDITLGLTDKA